MVSPLFNLNRPLGINQNLIPNDRFGFNKPESYRIVVIRLSYSHFKSFALICSYSLVPMHSVPEYERSRLQV